MRHGDEEKKQRHRSSRQDLKFQLNALKYEQRKDAYKLRNTKTFHLVFFQIEEDIEGNFYLFE